MIKKIYILLTILVLLAANSLQAATASTDDPVEQVTWTQLTNLSYLWNSEFKPSITKALDNEGLSILLAGAAATVAAHQFDQDIYTHNSDRSRRILNQDLADLGSSLGSGTPGIAIAIAQLIFDRNEGVAHAKAIALTSLSHITTATIVHRERPNKKNHLSFPSGHTSSSFASATALAYSYGYKAAIPAYLIASFVGLARINENIHWASDVAAGAALGIFWGRATANFKKDSNFTFAPTITNDYAGATFNFKWD